MRGVASRAARTITVTGHGTATAVPDAAVVRLAAVHRAASLAEALSGAESARAAIVAAAGDLVVSSTSLDVWPSHDQQGRPSGFEARHSLASPARPWSKPARCSTGWPPRSATGCRSTGVSLTVTDPTAALAQAREAAYADARARADQLAELARAVLGEVQQVVEGGGGAPFPERFELRRWPRPTSGSRPGQTVLTSTVTVTWALV